MKPAATVVLFAMCVVPLASGAAPPVQRQAELVNLIKHDWGSCHGLTLQGGLGPALTPKALQERVPNYLVRVILDGRPGTAMPPWRDLLSSDDVAWIVHALQTGVDKNAP